MDDSKGYQYINLEINICILASLTTCLVRFMKFFTNIKSILR